MATVAGFIDEVLTRKDDATLARVKAAVRELTRQFPLYAAPRHRAVAAHHDR
jgi:glycine/serine hydroxymethyltransferase